MDQESSTNESSITSNLPSALQRLGQPARLPTEILIQIFLRSLPPLDVPQAPHKTTLALVCRLWNAIIESTPILWTEISATDSTTYVQKSLLKSGELPISIYGERQEIHRKRDRSSCGYKFLPAVISHAGRWRHVSLLIRTQSFTPSVTTFSSLRSLLFDSWSNTPIDEGFFLLMNATNSPHLREVRLYGTTIVRWELISFPPCLSTLEIEDISGVQPSPNGWLSILARCPNLTVLRLCNIRGQQQRKEGDKNGHANAPAAVLLPALQELELDCIPNDHVREFLNRLIIPEECIVSVGYFGAALSPSTSFLTPALSHHRGRFQHGEVTITFVPSKFWVKVVRQRWCLNLRLNGEGVEDALEWCGISTTDNSNAFAGSETLQAGSTTSENTPITLKLCKYDSSSLVNFDNLPPVPYFRCLHRIETDGLASDEHATLFWYLSGPENPYRPSSWSDYWHFDGPRRKKQTTGVWPFPCVCELVLKGMDAEAMCALLDAIRNRSGDGAMAGVPGMPARLKRIEFVDGDWRDWTGCPRVADDPHEVEQLVLDILNVLDDDAELVWRGTRISKA